MFISTHHVARIETHNLALRTAVEGDPALGSTVSDVWLYLQGSEALLIALLSGTPPPPNQDGEPEWGLGLYLLHQLPPLVVETLNILGMPQTNISSAMIAGWEATLTGAGVVASDGTIYSTTKFAALDPDWVYAIFEYIMHRSGTLSTAAFGTEGKVINVTEPLTIALTSDWGTGQWEPGCPSQAVMDAIKALKPDVGIHLGDVYYAGTEHGSLYFNKGEEANNLVDLWPTFPLGSFTLNSNHEMYNGANGYFKVALTSKTFQGQKGASYFALQGSNFVVIGLDTAYYDTSPMIMQGALAGTDQLNFIKSLDVSGKAIIVLTHHNGLKTDGTERTDLFRQVALALGRAPDFWYWGHVHNGIVYSDQSAAGPATKARCIGHGALPFGNAFALHDGENNIPTVSYYTHTPVEGTNRVLNGFATLTLTAEAVTETFYDQEGSSEWTLTTALPIQRAAVAGSR